MPVTRRELLTAAAGVALAGCARSPRPLREAPEPAVAGPLRFPPGFRWGAATSAYQIEGAVAEDGRGASVWDTFSHRSWHVRDGSTGDMADDHYHRYREDVALMGGLGLSSYRFSVSWSRVLPSGRPPVNQKGLDFYRRLVDALRLRGIAPMATLWHWDTPQVLQDVGGWENRDVAQRFADYAGVLGRGLGDDVQAYLTLNEPKTVVQNGYLLGVHAPGIADRSSAARALHHLLLGHGLAVSALRASGVRADIGIALNLSPCYPADDGAASRQAAVLLDGAENRLYLDPVLAARYPEDVLGSDRVDGAALRAAVHDRDLATIAAPIDLLGVNYYNPFFVRPDGRTVRRYPTALAPWLQTYPPGLYDVLTRLRRDYGDLALSVTENGRPTATARAADGSYPDDDRIRFLRDHLVEAHRAIQAGVRLTGYHAWSLLDNFEWAEGYTQRWGLVHVDFRTQQRTPKRSASWYRDIIAGNAVT